MERTDGKCTKILPRVQNSGWIQPSFDNFSFPPPSTTARYSDKNSRPTSAAESNRVDGSGKRKLEQCSNGIPEQASSLETPSNLTKTFKKPKKMPRRRPPISKSPRVESFLDKYAPKSTSELALHHRKLEVLRKWFSVCSSNTAGVSFLLVTGPSGCGKMTAVKVLAESNGFEICEWTSPQHWREFHIYRTDSNQSNSQTDIIPVSQIGELSSFLLRACCVQPVVREIDVSGTSRRKCVIVKELPNEFFDKPNEFENIVRAYSRKTKGVKHSLVVFIVTTNSAGNTISNLNWKRLFPREMLDELKFNVVEFNPVANSLLVKALRRILDSELLDMGKSQLDRLVEQSNGDVRYAINELQLLHSGPSSSSDASNRDSALLLFRGLGRCLYSKRKRDTIDLQTDQLLPSHLKSHYARPHILDFDPELTVEQTGFQPSTFALFLQENVLDFFVDHHSITKMADNVDNLTVLDELLEIFSQTDMLANPANYEYREKMAVYEKSIPARAVAFYCWDSAGQRKGTYKCMRRPKWLDTRRQIQQVGSTLTIQSAIRVVNGRVDVSEYRPFAPTLINRERKFDPGVSSGTMDSGGIDNLDLEEEMESNEASTAHLRAGKESERYVIGMEEVNVAIDQFEDF